MIQCEKTEANNPKDNEDRDNPGALLTRKRVVQINEDSR